MTDDDEARIARAIGGGILTAGCLAFVFYVVLIAGMILAILKWVV